MSARSTAVARFALLFALSLVAIHALRDASREDVLGSDEPEWLAISVLHTRQLLEGGDAAGAEIERRPTNPDREPRPEPTSPWMRGVQGTTFGYMNPCLPKLVWGGVLIAAGHGEVSPLVFQSFHRDDPAAGARAREALLPGMPLARRVVEVFAALAASFVPLVVSRALAGAPPLRARMAAALAWLAWVGAPLVQRTSSYLRTDHFMLALLLAAVLWTLHRRERLFGESATGERLRAAAGLGVLLGLCVSAKLNGALAAMGFVLVAVVAVIGTPARARGVLLSLLTAGLVAAAVFVALHPVTWPVTGLGPVEGFREKMARWSRHTGFIQNAWAPRTGVEIVRTPFERLDLFSRAVFGRHEPLAALTGWPLGVPLALVGGFGLARRRGAGAVLLAFALVLLVGTALTLPIDWERLYLPAVLAMVLLEAVGVATLVGLARRRATD